MNTSLVAGMVVQHTSALRNKRLLLAYLCVALCDCVACLAHDHPLHRNERMRRVERIRWDYGSVLLDTWKNKMSSSEVDYFKGYNEVLNGYMRGVGMDLTADLTPPKHLHVNLRILADVGEIMTVSGRSLQLNKDDVVMLRRADAEALIRQGKAVHVRG